jgi:SAM-dependent methyltransferase
MTDLPRRLERLSPASPEPEYEHLAAYAFARRYVGGKTVADVCWEEIGRGSRLLAGAAASVAGVTGSAGWVELASSAYPAPNTSYEAAQFPALPQPDDSFDVLVALGVAENLEEPERFLEEVGRVLRPGGVLVISFPDKAHDATERSGMYAAEVEDLLGRHFVAVKLYGLGAVAGGFIGPYSGEAMEVSVQGFSSSAADPTPENGRLATRSIVAVCGGVDPPEERPLLLLDGDRRVFEEHEDLARDVGLMWEEVDRMQETEAQSFRDTLNLFKSEVSYLRAQLRRSEARTRQLESQRARLGERIEDMENSATWRVFEPYRRLRGRIDAARSPGPENGKEVDDSGRS